jgi:murein L,D-transpeptidase YcbB/YkuD
MFTQRYGSINKFQPMTDDQLQKVAPSIFASEPWHKMSSRYTFLPTIDVVRKMRIEGFQPVTASQSRTRIEGKEEFTRHMIRFRDMRNGDQPVTRTLGTLYPELVLTNSHDGASAFKLDAGLFRLVCTNGLVVNDGEFSQINVRHKGNADDIIEASYEVVEQFPRVIESVAQFNQLRLTAPQQEAFTEAALQLRYDENEHTPIQPSQVLRPTRSDDVEPTLWNTLNRVQERLINGGVRGQNKAGRRTTTRAISSIAENLKLNKALWTLTAKMRELMN